jgi:Tfp pilus assembly protein PilF
MIGAVNGTTQKPAWLSSLVICVGLTSLIWLIFGQTLGHQFVSYDDQNYVYDNPIVTGGFSANGVRAAFTESYSSNWHPLTTLSHMLDCQLFGLDPAGHHFTNVLLHTGAALLLFLIVRAMTGRTWVSAFVAALFAIHPLRVESVAWVAERKDVLSACAFMVTLGLYFRYTVAPSAQRYVAVMAGYALGLMAKPMLVTTPLLLLLLDYWPLRRLQRSTVLEKIPLLLLSVASGIATLLAQKSVVDYTEATPLMSRLGNAATACVTYIWQMFWPLNLAVIYPRPRDGFAAGTVLFSVILLILITAATIIVRKKRPYLIVGWLWYLVCLSPTLGLIPVGLQAHADRYTYLPQIGLYIALTWLAGDLLTRIRGGKRAGAFVAATVVVILTSLAWKQSSTWRNTETLWQHALAVSPDNAVAHNNLALFDVDHGHLDDAIAHYERALAIVGDREIHSQISPALLHNNLGLAFSRKGGEDQAAAHYRKAIELRDDFADAHTNLATLLLAKGSTAEAIEHYRKAVNLPPEDVASHARLATALQRSGQIAEAINEYRRALELSTDPEVSRILKKTIEAGEKQIERR